MFTKQLSQQLACRDLRWLNKNLAILSCSLFLIAPYVSAQTAEITSTPVAPTAPAVLEAPSVPPLPLAKAIASVTEEVVVVGSRIRRTTFDSPAPIQVVTREESTAAGFNSTSEMLQSAAITTGAAQINNAFGGFVTDGGPGANTISLRGLGASRTLVLINGRRVAPAGTRGAVGSADLNVLPTAMVDRVDILRDGASSVYGSDAIGGVVNVITMKNFEGISLEGEHRQPSEEGGEQSRFSISGGLVEDRWSVAGSLDILKRADLSVGQRDWVKCDVDGFRDPDTLESLDYIDPKTGKPKCNTISGRGTAGVTVNTIGTQAVTATNFTMLGLNGPVVGAAGSSGTTFTRFRPNANVTTGVAGFEGVGGGTNNLNVRDTLDERSYNESLISPVKVFTTYIESKFDLQALGDAELYFELLANRRESEQTGFRQLSLDYRRGSPLIPANLSYGNFGADQGTSEGERVGVRAFIGFGNDLNEQTLDYVHPTIGIKGDLSFLPDWKYDSYVSYAKSDAEYKVESFFTDKVTYSTNAIAAPSGTNPALVRNGLTCAINLTNPGENCVVAPALTASVIGGNLPQDFSDYIFRDVVGNTKYEETIVSATIDGPLYNLPAGNLQGVLGLEYRASKINDAPDQNSIDGNLYNLSSAAPTVGKDNVTEVFTEVEVPVLADTANIKEFTLSGSYRLTDYDSYGSGTTYKYGFMLSPSDWLTFRGTVGTSFRAPALFEQFQGATSGFLSSNNDPCNNYDAAGVNPNRAVNCASEGLPAGFQATSGIQTLNVGGGASGLEAETSENKTFGIIFQPDMGTERELSLALDYFDIEIQNGVSQAGADEILPRCYDDAQFKSSGGLCRLVSRDSATKQLLVSDAYTNLATQVSEGVDFTGRYKQNIGPGEMLVNISTTRYQSQADKIFEADDLRERNHAIFYPTWSGSGSISYKLESWRVSYGVDWIGDMDSYADEEEDPYTSEYDLKVPSYLTHRVSVRYQTDTWEATLGVRNLTDEIPPSVSSQIVNRVGNVPLYSGYDYVGREFFVNTQIHF
jgi:iron complex outermembrane recepter protein